MEPTLFCEKAREVRAINLLCQFPREVGPTELLCRLDHQVRSKRAIALIFGK